MNTNQFASISSIIIGSIFYLFYNVYSGFAIISLNIILYVYIFLQYKNNKPLVLYVIYSLIFQLYLIPKFYFNVDIVYYDYYNYDDLYNKSLYLILIYISSLLFFLKKIPNGYSFPEYDNRFKKSNLISYINIFILILIFLFGFSGKNILDNAIYGTEEFGTKTIFTEYFIIFLIFALIYSNKKIIDKTVIFIAFMMILKSLLWGSRVSALMIIITLFLLKYTKKINAISLTLLSFFGIIGMNFFGMMRSKNISVTLDYLLRIQDRFIFSSTQSNMFYGSVNFLGLIEDQVFDNFTRLKSLIGFIIRIFTPTSVTLEEGSLASYSQLFSPTGGGAHFTAYFYVWFSWLGPILFGFVFASILNKIHYKKINNFFYLFILIVFATLPRWHGYEPGVIFKMGWIIIFLYFLYEKLLNNRKYSTYQHYS